MIVRIPVIEKHSDRGPRLKELLGLDCPRTWPMHVDVSSSQNFILA